MRIRPSLPDGTYLDYSVNFLIVPAVVTPSVASLPNVAYTTFTTQVLRSLSFTTTATAPTNAAIVVVTEYQQIGGTQTTIPNFLSVTAQGETGTNVTPISYRSTLASPTVQLRVFSETLNNAGLGFVVTVYACLAQDTSIRSASIQFTVTTVSAQIVESANTFNPASPQSYQVYQSALIILLAQTYTTIPSTLTQPLSYSVMQMVGSVLTPLPASGIFTYTSGQISVYSNDKAKGLGTYTLVLVASMPDTLTKNVIRTISVTINPCTFQFPSPLTNWVSTAYYTTWTTPANIAVSAVKVNPTTTNSLVPIYKVTCTAQAVGATPVVLSTTSSPLRFVSGSLTLTVGSNNYTDEGTYKCCINAAMLDESNQDSSFFNIEIRRAVISVPTGSLTVPQGPHSYTVLGTGISISISAFTHNGNVAGAVLGYEMSSVTPASSGPVWPFRFVSSSVAPPAGLVYVNTSRNGDAKTYSVEIKAFLPDNSFITQTFNVVIAEAKIYPPFQLAPTIPYAIYQYT